MIYLGPKAFLNVVSELSLLPGIGEKTAQRLVFHLLEASEEQVKSLAEAIAALKNQIRFCQICCGLTSESPCPICASPERDVETICVVEDPSDLMAIERTAQYRGLYHVLHGSLSPLEGRGPKELKVAELLKRLEKNKPREVILATNPDVEGEATALYIAKLLSEKGIATTRIALGLPMGGHLEYADHLTVSRAISERRHFHTK